MKRRRPRRTGKPGKEVGLDVHRYLDVVRELRSVRSVYPIDTLKEEQILDHLDVIWTGASSVDQKEIVYRLGPKRGR